MTVEQGGFGVDTAAPAAREILNAYFSEQGPAAGQADAKAPAVGVEHRGTSLDTDGSQALTRGFDHGKAAKSPVERTGVLRLDPILICAALALIGASLYTLGVTTSGDIAHNPYYYVLRQAIYAVVGMTLMLAVARVDYSRFRELRVGLYTVMIASIILVFALGRPHADRKRWIDLPFFSLQTSELGKVLLDPGAGGFAIDRAGGCRSGGGRCGSWCWASSPAALVFAQPDLGTAARVPA